MGRRSVRIDASNLFAGGGVQVAASFLTEVVSGISAGWSDRFPWLDGGFAFEVSSEVARNAGEASLEPAVIVTDRPPWKAATSLVSPSTVRFTVFGPAYTWARACRRVSGFADGTSLSSLDDPAARVEKQTLRPAVSRQLFKREHQVVVEAAHIRSALVSEWGLDPASVVVVPNVLNGIFTAHPAPVSPRAIDRRNLRVAYVARRYAHKNHDVLGHVGALLHSEGVEVRFHLTLTAEEWQALPEDVRAFSVNVGVLPVAALPGFYADMDVAIFPSLRESFSATPLEAMWSGLPLFASDRNFVSSVCGDSAHYFDPTDPRSIAAVIKEVLADPTRLNQSRIRGLAIARAWPTAIDRAISYLELIDRQLRAATTLPEMDYS